MLSIQSIHHLSFRVPEVAAAKRFWCGLLGFTEIPRPDIGVPGAWLQGFGVEVHLLAPPGQGAGTGAGELNPTRNHVAFRVDDLEGVRDKLKAAGAQVLEGSAGIRQIFVLSPGSNVIEFIAPG